MSGVLYRTFADISNGYSACTINATPAFIKHMSFRDRVEIDWIQEKEFAAAVKQGIPDEKKRLEQLKKEGLWTDANDRELRDQIQYVKSMVDGKKHIPVPSILMKHLENIKTEEAKLQEIRDKKSQLLGLTAEGFAQKVVNDHYIYSSFYRDRQLTSRLWEYEEFGDLDEEEVDKVAAEYDININKVCSDENIKKLCIQGFFQSHFVLCDNNISVFYGKPVIEFTLLQVQLANKALYFKYLYENNDIAGLPENVREDPDLMVDYLETKKKGKEAAGKAGNQDIIGATAADREAIGIVSSKPVLPNKRLTLDYFVQNPAATQR